ncbi:chemotaxis response regulator protein-glutamate methylesterase [Ectothiorhodospira shaposhnikovii]|uniref:protein-glutamate methylesterase/protein-glutamine glutaminase n=1 Tax=Ectothiorhodospira shaposhnikovii TaxID=1054 RepID=UPI00190855DA|nr:chemotaxis response regulator protein-glutamate methylesterase [Ectothiorhodospira shaposhnikovii]MBK1674026.1 chemotaxis response regulator protein-glutamate methylesterase [Ectothiorhodospira shaposhnikovii]
MAVRVLVVDDSGFFRRRIVEILNADPSIEVVGTASNGQDAIDLAARLNPDVITMDIEMPVMDGITAVKRIMAQRPVPILMFSSLTTEGARATLEALEAGAVDFLPKKFEDIARDQEQAKEELRRRVRTVGRRRIPGLASGNPPGAVPAAGPGIRPSVPMRPSPQPAVQAPSPAVARPSRPVTDRAPLRLRDFKVVLIGTSTGGPLALQKVLCELPASFPLPLLLIQHMPATFTPAFAQRLDQLCRIQVKEAVDGDVLAPGLALLAPGGKQMVVDSARSGQHRIRITESAPEQHYRPSVDVTFNSAAAAFRGDALAIIMTGMGADGREGARLLKSRGSKIWAQDEESCVVYGMPAAVVDAGLADRVLPLSQIGKLLAEGS